MKRRGIIVFVILVLLVLPFILAANHPTIEFVAPTPADGSTQSNTDIFVNLSTADVNGTHYAFVDFDDDLVLWMRMDDTNSTGDPTDLSKWSNNGSLVAGALINSSGYWGNGSHLDGDVDYIELGDKVPFKLADELTLSLWIRPLNDFDEGAVTTIVGKNDASIGGYRFYRGTSGRLFLVLSNGTDNDNLISSNNIEWNANQWYHIAVTFINSSYSTSFYRDGAFINTDSSGDNTFAVAGTNSLTIGGVANTNFNGSIDEVLIFNRSLSAGEISSLYNASATQYFNNFTSLADGTHTFTGHAVDLAGNKNDTAQQSVTVDSTGCDGPQAGTNWNITASDDCTFTNAVLNVSRDNNVTVYGNLTLVNTILNMNVTSQAAAEITVFSGGRFNVSQGSVINETNNTLYDLTLNSGSFGYFTDSILSRYLNFNTAGLQLFDNNTMQFVNTLHTTSGVNITNSVFESYINGGSDAYILIQGDTNVIVENVTVERGDGSVGSPMGIFLRGNSDGSKIRNFTTVVANAGEIRVRGTTGNVTFENLYCFKTGANPCFEFRTTTSTGEVYVIDSFINETVNVQVDYISGIGGIIYFINVTNANASLFTNAGTDSFGYIQWYLDVNVTDSNGNAIQNANVTLFNNASLAIFSELTGSDGLTSLHNVTSDEVNGTGVFSKNFHTVNVTASGYSDFTNATVNVIDNIRIEVMLTENVVPNVTINFPTATTYGSSDIPLNFNITLSENGSIIYSLDNGVNNVSMLSEDEGQSKFGTLFNSTNNSIADGTYIFSVYANDTAGNNNYTENVTFTIDTSTSTSSSSSSSSSGTPTWIFSYRFTDQEFSEIGTITQELSARRRIKIKISEEEHYVGVISLNENNALMEIASDPQQVEFNIGETKKFDVTHDEFYDLEVKLIGIEINKANISLSYLHEEISSDVEEVEEQTTDEEPAGIIQQDSLIFNMEYILFSVIILGVVVLMIIVVLFYRKKRKK